MTENAWRKGTTPDRPADVSPLTAVIAAMPDNERRIAREGIERAHEQASRRTKNAVGHGKLARVLRGQDP